MFSNLECVDKKWDCVWMLPYCYNKSYKEYLTAWCPRTCGFCSSKYKSFNIGYLYYEFLILVFILRNPSTIM